jgi:multisubunit Na+/H+ antiporter MnhG subunit
MTPRVAASIALLVLGVGIELACCVGVLVMRGVYDKLHYTAPATTLGAFAIAGAVVLRTPLAQFGLKALLVATALLVTNAVLTHAAHPPLRRVDDPGG